MAKIYKNDIFSSFNQIKLILAKFSHNFDYAQLMSGHSSYLPATVPIYRSQQFLSTGHSSYLPMQIVYMHLVSWFIINYIGSSYMYIEMLLTA